jgi:hypothetical protein
MSISTITQLNSSVLSCDSSWDLTNQKELAGLKPPELLMGIRTDILQGDISREWCKWIIEQFIDNDFLSSEISFIKVYKEVSTCLTLLLGKQLDDDDKDQIAKHLSNLVLERVEYIKEDKQRRKNISKEIKEELLTIYGDKPRCWLTGYEFTKEAVFNFTANKLDKVDLILPIYVDRYRPIGLKERDICIEIDHLHPFSLGGKDCIDNYRLICGWANKVKSNHISGYSYGTKLTGTNKLYPKSYYYWVLRVIGLKRKCEIQSCKNDIYNSELTVCSSLGSSKSINPVSMMVVCKEHDTLNERFLKR